MGRLALLVFAVAVVLDASRPADRQATAAIAIGGVRAYQRTLAPVFDRCGSKCRFTPSCSHYAEAVLRRHGGIVGTWLAVRRVARCGPWTAAGTADPPR